MADRSLTLASVVGARPQFVKASIISQAIGWHAERSRTPFLEHVLIHTGQHYDDCLSGTFFEQLQIPTPAFHLEVGSHTAGRQTALMLERLEGVFKDFRPDVVLVYGDTNSTLAAALAAKQAGLPLIHLEAGLRCYDLGMPEELNRVVTDRISDLHLSPTPTAVKNLCRENLGDTTVLVPDVMEEALSRAMPIVLAAPRAMAGLAIHGPFAVATIHRAENTDPERLDHLVATLEILAKRLPIVLPLHPRTKNALKRTPSRLRLIDPVPYREMLGLLWEASLVLTDSGGLQKEACWLGVPCITLRDKTEWVETLSQGDNILCGADRERTLHAAEVFLDRQPADRYAALARLKADAGDANLACILKFMETL